MIILFDTFILKMLSRHHHEAPRLELVSQSMPDAHKDNLIAKLEFQCSVKKIYTGNIYSQYWRVANAHLTSRDKFRVYHAAYNAQQAGVLANYKFEIRDNDIKIYDIVNERRVVIAVSTQVLIQLVKVYS